MRLPSPRALLLGVALCLPGCMEELAFPTTPETDGACRTAACQPIPSRPEGSLRIAAFNVRRLFDTTCDTGACGGSNYEALPTPGEFGAQADRLAEALLELDADIVLLSEVETQASLEALQARLPGFPHAVLGETGAPASVDVAVLSAFPITGVQGHRDQVLTRPDGSTTHFSRELLEVHLDARGSEAIVFAAHFKSKSDDDPGRRLAEAQASRGIIATVAQAFPGSLVVMGGDLNDVPGSEPLNALEQDGSLLRVASDRPDSETWTYTFNGEHQAIDHLYLARDGGGAYLPGSFRAIRGTSRGGYGGSDHAAVYADFLPEP